MHLQNKVGLWVNDTGSVLDSIHVVREIGFDYIVARVINRAASGFVATQPENLAELIARATAVEIPVYCWYYAYPDLIDDQIAAIRDHLPATVGNLILDVEDEWENLAQSASSANNLTHRIAVAIDHRADLHLSTFYFTSAHHLPYTAFLAHCESLMPQVYRVPVPGGGLSSIDLAINRTIGDDPHLAKQSLGGLLIATANRPEMLQAVASHPTVFQGANVWLWDGDTEPVITDPGVRNNVTQWTEAVAAFKSIR